VAEENPVRMGLTNLPSIVPFLTIISPHPEGFPLNSSSAGVLPSPPGLFTNARVRHMRFEVQEYMRVSANLFGLAYKKDALTLAERAAIVAFAQELEKKFLPPREERDVPLPATLSNAPLMD